MRKAPQLLSWAQRRQASFGSSVHSGSQVSLAAEGRHVSPLFDAPNVRQVTNGAARVRACKAIRGSAKLTHVTPTSLSRNDCRCSQSINANAAIISSCITLHLLTHRTLNHVAFAEKDVGWQMECGCMFP